MKMIWNGWKIEENCHALVNQSHGNFCSKTLCCRKIKSVFRDVKWCFNASWGLKGLICYRLDHNGASGGLGNLKWQPNALSMLSQHLRYATLMECWAVLLSDDVMFIILSPLKLWYHAVPCFKHLPLLALRNVQSSGIDNTLSEL